MNEGYATDIGIRPVVKMNCARNGAANEQAHVRDALCGFTNR